MSVTTGTSAVTHYFDEAGEYHPCRCGEQHRGPYAIEDWMMHNCFHTQELLQLQDGLVLCVECGQAFSLIKEELE